MMKKILKGSILSTMMLYCIVTSLAQTVYFNNEPVQNTFQEIEDATPFRFNYNPKVLESFSYTGQLTLNDIQSILKALQLQMPLQFEQQDSTILIILPEQKTKKICGYLFCENNNIPLASANLYFMFSKTGIVTDEHGFFEIETMCYDNEPVLLSYVGYESKELPISLLEKKKCPTIELSLNENVLEIGLEIKDYKTSYVEEVETYGGVSLNYERMLSEENFIDSDVFKNIQILPGVNSFDDSATNISIRGNKQGHNITRWENVQLYHSGHFFSMLSAMNPFLVDDVQIYKSSFHPNLGNTIGGIIDISLSDEITKKFEGGIGLDMNKAFTYFKAPLVKNKLSISLAAQFSTNSLFESPTLKSYKEKIFQNSTLDTDVDSFEEINILFYDAQAKLNFKPSEKWSVNTSFLLNNERFRVEKYEVPNCWYPNKMIRIFSNAMQAEVLYKPNTKNQFKGFYTSSKYNNIDDFVYSRRQVNNEISSTEVGLSYELQHSDQWKSDFSISMENKKLRYERKYTVNILTLRQDHCNINLTEGAVALKYKDASFVHQSTSTSFSNDRWNVNLGIRNSWHRTIQTLFLSPRANVQYKINKTVNLKASAGWHYQFLSQYTRLDFEDINYNPHWYLNGSEPDEILNARKLSVGGSFQHKGWLIDAEAYLQKTHNLPGITNLINTEKSMNFLGTGFSRGIDMIVKKNWEALTLWANYTLSKNEYTFTEISDDPFPAPNDNRHNLSIFTSYKYKNWQLALNFRARTSLPYTGLTDSLDTDKPGFYYIDYDNYNNLRLPGFYSRLDIALNYKQTLFNDAIQLNGRFAIINVLNKKNYQSIDYHFVEDAFGKPKPVRIENFSLGFTPQLTFQFSRNNNTKSK